MLELIKKIREYTEAGIILEHMYLLDLLETNAKALETINREKGINVVKTASVVDEFYELKKDNK